MPNDESDDQEDEVDKTGQNPQKRSKKDKAKNKSKKFWSLDLRVLKVSNTAYLDIELN